MIKKRKTLTTLELPEFQQTIDEMAPDSRIFVDKSMEIADFILHTMQRKGMKQKDLAIKMGKSEAEVSKILAGMHNLTLRMIAKVEAALECDVIVTPKTQLNFRELEIAKAAQIELQRVSKELSEAMVKHYEKVRMKSNQGTSKPVGKKRKMVFQGAAKIIRMSPHPENKAS